MTQTEKIIALAELEGIKVRPYKSFSEVPIGVPLGEGRFSWKLPPYLTSHDALQPLLEKVTEEQWGNMSMEVMKLGRTPFQSFTELCLTLTPEQKADCILKACGKWKE